MAALNVWGVENSLSDASIFSFPRESDRSASINRELDKSELSVGKSLSSIFIQRDRFCSFNIVADNESAVSLNPRSKRSRLAKARTYLISEASIMCRRLLGVNSPHPRGIRPFGNVHRALQDAREDSLMRGFAAAE